MRIALVNMPFANWHYPSFALSQLAALGHHEFPGQVTSDVFYLNHDFARYFGLPEYDSLANDGEHLLAGLGEWVFRDIAFPEAGDNERAYFRRYYRGPRWLRLRERVLQRRPGLEERCRELIDRYRLASYDVVGFSSMFAQNVPSIAVARLIKEINPEVVTLMGGANCEAPMGAVIAEQTPTIDFVFSGPSMHTYPELLRALLNGDTETAHAIPGIVTGRNCGDPRFRNAVGRDRDIEDHIPPDYSGWLTALPRDEVLWKAVQDGTAHPQLYFETSRGCWWGARSHCTFCGLNGLGMDYRALSAGKAIRQFERLFELAPWCNRYVCTDNIMPRNYPKEVFGPLQPPAGTSIFYEVKVPIADHDLEAMVSGGVNQIQPGIEALSTQTLSIMRKGTTAFQNLQFLKKCMRHGIEPYWNLLIGFPGEPESVFQKYFDDLPSLVHLPPPNGVYVVRFDRYSPYHTNGGFYGLELRPSDHYRYVYPFPEDTFTDLAYYFTDEKLGPYAAASTRWHARLSERVEEWTRAWSRRPPSLTLERGADGQEQITDSRGGGPATTLPVDAETRLLLHRLSSPAKPDRLAAELGLDPEAVARRLALLRERSLLFEEDGKILSLVLTEAGAQADLPASLEIV
ncbi:RiPP maturation radical SAM C-methyltransferase [Nonomuraea sp. NPDC001023]|uniref:RiPP maturation radical SAM C-methyltransferase n=1 Tax=unclassified Nonomuraea TaxID=2593643 RepID=UPI0033256CDF